jgi:hypothetical protein
MIAPNETGGEDGLLALQSQVARKADELARTQIDGAHLHLHCWLLAEREIFRGALTDWIGGPATFPAPAAIGRSAVA